MALARTMLLGLLALTGCYGSRAELGTPDGGAVELTEITCPSSAGRVCCGDTICAEGELCHHGCEREGSRKPTCTPSLRIAAERCGHLDEAALVVACDGPEDCAGDEVCTLFAGNTHETRCAPGGRDVLCHGDLDCAGDMACVSVPTALGYRVSGGLSDHAICVP